MSVFDLCGFRKDQTIYGLLGEFVGRGQSRDVYKSPIDKNIVIKIAYNAQGIIDNTDEWSLWCLSEGKDLRNWLCPIIGVFGDGRVLYMRRAEHAPESGLKSFKKVPEIFGDVHIHNWGYFEGRLVCFDYAINNSASVPKKLKMKKAAWHG